MTELNNPFVFVGAQGTIYATEDAIVLESGSSHQAINYGEIVAQEAGI